jgi:hypothetical protein
MDKQNFNRKDRNTLRTDESIIAGESEKIKKFFKALAVLVVFFVSFSTPFYLSYKTQENAKALVVKINMSQLSNWAKIYELRNGDYYGLENNSEIKRIFDDIKSEGGNAYIFIDELSKKYCSEAKFTKKELGIWCIDSTGYIGKKGNCTADTVSCE